MKIAVIDIGTNTTRFIVFDVSEQSFRTLHEEDIITRLGENLASGSLQTDAIDRTLQVIRNFRDRAGDLGVKKIVAVGTSALRGAENKQFFLDSVKALGITLRVITGEEEAKLAFRGVVSGRKVGQDESIFVVDIGGGSTELIVGKELKVVKWLSINEGAVRLTERFIRNDPPAADELEKMEKYVDEKIHEAKDILSVRSPVAAVGVAGTIVSLAMMSQSLADFTPDKIHGYNLTVDEVERLYRLLSTSTVQVRKTIPGMEPDRADVIPAGACLLLSIMKCFGLKNIEVSLNDLRHGVVLEELHK